MHADIEDIDCTSCHDPHGSDNKFMLQAGLCVKCHEDFNNTYSFLHGPVAAGYCSACHGPHLEKSENLLMASGQQLCLNCHNPGLIFKGDYHNRNNDKNCTECHNPHGGEDNHILK